MPARSRPASTLCVRGLAAALAALCGAAPALASGAGTSALGLPTRTIVVRDFARLRQDLYDTLKVNLPGALVEILKFKGAEVVLEVELKTAAPPRDMAKALQELSRHCDRVIRMTVPGMFLSQESKLAVRAATPADAASSPGAEVSTAAAAATTAALDPATSAGFVADLLAGPEDGAAGRADAGADALYAASSSSSRGLGGRGSQSASEMQQRALRTEGLKAYLARISGAVPPPPPPVPPAPLALAGSGPRARTREGVRPETLQALEVYAAEPAPDETGEARAALEELTQRRALLEKLHRSDGVSSQTMHQVQQFHESGRLYEGSSSTETVRSIYRTIREDRSAGIPTITLQELVSGTDRTARSGPRPAAGLAEEVFESELPAVLSSAGVTSGRPHETP